MKATERPHGYRGGYVLGFLMMVVVVLRVLLFYWGQPGLVLIILLITIYALLYSFEPWLSNRFAWYSHFYFPLQTALVITLSNLRPFMDFQTILYFPLCIQLFRTFTRPIAFTWILFLSILLGFTLIFGLGLWEALALFLLNIAMGTFLVSYDFLYIRTQADQAESQRLLADLQLAHHKLQEQTAQAEELAAARERNRLARELHDSVSQIIFGITFTSQSARLLLERDPVRVPEQIEHLQNMTSSALDQLRSLIAELRPH
jgi:signal transduction histidine kinase